MTQKQAELEQDINDMVSADEKRLGVGSKEFLDRHQEIMDLCDKAEEGLSHAKKKTQTT